MNYQQFRSLVTAMRIAQKLYFKTRDQAVLAESKRLEHQVDKALAEYDEGQKNFLEDDNNGVGSLYDLYNPWGG